MRLATLARRLPARPAGCWAWRRRRARLQPGWRSKPWNERNERPEGAGRWRVGSESGDRSLKLSDRWVARLRERLRARGASRKTRAELQWKPRPRDPRPSRARRGGESRSPFGAGNEG